MRKGVLWLQRPAWKARCLQRWVPQGWANCGPLMGPLAGPYVAIRVLLPYLFSLACKALSYKIVES